MQFPGGAIGKSVLNSFAKSTEKHLCWSLFLNNVASLTSIPPSLLDPKESVFLWILQKFLRTTFLWNTSGDFFCKRSCLAHLSLPTGIYLLQVDNGKTVQSYEQRHQNHVIDVIMVSISSILNRFHTLYWCFHCWIWKSKSQLGMQSRWSSNWIALVTALNN